METFLGIMIPFLGTTLGAACVFFMKKSLGDLVQRALAGFAAGYFCGIAAGKKLPRELPAFSVCLAAVSGANLFVTLVCAYAANSELRPVRLIIHTLIPEFFYTLLFGIPVVLLGFLCTKLAGKTKRDRQASADTRF